jgi:CarboxypepD_reg-like domain
MKLTFLLMLSSLFSFGQKSFNGNIINKVTKEKIPFVTIGLAKENIGINADEDGFFTLISNKKFPNDTLIISCVGYETFKIILRDSGFEFKDIELSELKLKLTEVVINSKKNWETIILNDFKKCGNNYISSNGFQTQIARHFQTNIENSKLEEIRICRLSHRLFGNDKSKFRIRIYAIDLCGEVIEVTTNSKTVVVNLSKYKIRIPNRDFFVAVEWLIIPFNESKTRSIRNGIKEEHISYKPSISFTDDNLDKSSIWMLDYKNVWRLMFGGLKTANILISAKIKY